MDEFVFDPIDARSVEHHLVEQLRLNWPNAKVASRLEYAAAATSAWVWFVELSGSDLPPPLRLRQVLRIFRREQGDRASREALLSKHLDSHAYPAPVTSWTGTIGDGYPAMLQSRLPGAMAIDALKSARIRSIICALGRVQAELHLLPIQGFPLPTYSAADYLQADLGRHRASVSATDPSGTWEWLCSTAASVDSSDRAVCHGDFHPLNVLVDVGISVGVIDWTDACIADPHLDIGRTTMLYGLAHVFSKNRFERLALRASRKRIVQWHLQTYEATASTKIDPQRLAWWQAVHAYRSWLQLFELREGAVVAQKSSTLDAMPDSVPELLLEQCMIFRRLCGY